MCQFHLDLMKNVIAEVLTSANKEGSPPQFCKLCRAARRHIYPIINFAC